jgi:hypothetical protein
MRASPILCAIAAAALSACATVNAAVNDQSYALEGGDVSYDALARAGAACKARGGTIKPSGQGDNTMLSNYYCSIPAGTKAP